MRCPWGDKALAGYLGTNQDAWKTYDATVLIDGGARSREILVDQGLADGFLEEQLKPELLEQSCQRGGQPLRLRRHDGYDHSYFFIASFVGEHIEHHARLLKA